MIPNAPQSDEQVEAYLDKQIASLTHAIAAGEQIVDMCGKGINALSAAPPATLTNIGEVVGALVVGLLALLRANWAANETSLSEMREQRARLEEMRRQRASKVHLGAFVPPRLKH